MRLHQENIFRYLLACFLVAAFGLVLTWSSAETDRKLNLAKTEASLTGAPVSPDRSTSSEHQ